MNRRDRELTELIFHPDYDHLWSIQTTFLIYSIPDISWMMFELRVGHQWYTSEYRFGVYKKDGGPFE